MTIGTATGWSVSDELSGEQRSPLRKFYNFDWVFAIEGWLRHAVEERFRGDLHRWPLLQSFDAEIYAAAPAVRLFVLKDKPVGGAAPSVSSGADARPWPEGAPSITEPLTVQQVAQTLPALRDFLSLRPQDAAIFVSVSEATSFADEFASRTNSDIELTNWQLSYTFRNQLHFVRGFDAAGDFMLPPGYTFLAEQCERFFVDHPRYDRNVFLMTRFAAESKALVALDVELRRVLRAHDLDSVRADDKMYMPDRNLWNNVCVYMLCCKAGIAILEDRVQDEFNPNVAIEYGFMRALNKPVLLLADVGFRNLRADIIGTLREPFDLTDIEGTVQPSVERWLGEL